MDIDRQFLETLLKKKDFEESTLKICKMEVESVLGKGENYLSTITRVRADVILGSGKTKKLSLISKDQHTTPLMKQMSVMSGVFVREIMMYRDILTKMEDVMLEVEDHSETLWCKCYDVRLYDRILLEDLTAKGYKMAKRHQQLDLNTAKFVVQNLAKFHAISRLLIERSELPLDVYGIHIWGKNEDSNKKMFQDTLTNLAKAMETWDGEWTEARSKLQNAIPSINENMHKFLTTKHEGFTVLNHGDCWTNNMLFRFSDEGHPIAMKFVDLQLCYIGTPVHDLHWLLSSSVPPEIRKSHLDHILETYATSLETNLKLFDYKGAIPTMSDIKKLYDDHKFLSICFATLLIPIVLASPQNALDLEQMIKEGDAAKSEGRSASFDPFKNLTEQPKKVIQETILEAMHNNVF